MTSAKEALEMLGINVDEAIETDKKRTETKPRDPRICLCGHAVNKHSTASGEVQCVPSRYWCPCKKLRPVIQVEDTRLFLRKSNGPNQEHALIRGIAASVVAEKDVKWIIDVACDICSKTSAEARIMPTPVTEFKTVSYEATGYDALVCEDCLEKIR
jgi:hypothetical protein